MIVTLPTDARASVTLVEDFFLVRRVALHRVDEVRHEIGAALVLVHDFGPRRLDRFVLATGSRCSRNRAENSRGSNSRMRDLAHGESSCQRGLTR